MPHLSSTARLGLIGVVLLLAGCASLSEALFGRPVTVDRSDSSPPTVQILIADVYVRDPDPGDFVVTTADASACTHPRIIMAVSADDPEGVRYVQLDDITIDPTCAPIPVRRSDGRPPPPPTFTRAPTVTVAGERTGLPDSSATAQTRITHLKQLYLAQALYERSSFCPADRPIIGGARVRVTARAGNFGGGTAESGQATLSLTCPGWRPPRRTPRSCPAGTSYQPDGTCR